MVLPNIDIISGLTGLEIIVSGYLFAIILLVRHARRAPNKKLRNRIIISAVGLIGVYHSWFGSAANFISLSLGFQALGPVVSVLGYAWGPALGATIWMYIASESIKNGRFKIPLTLLAAILSVSFIILVYANPLEFAFYRPSPEGGLPSSGFRGVAMALLAVLLIIMLIFMGPAFIISGLKKEDKSNKWRNISMGVGAMMLSLFGIIDAAVSDIPLILLVVVKAFIFTSVFLLYEGIDKGT
jgi:uncharacterized membrane protein HdeD (DUF308 family)